MRRWLVVVVLAAIVVAAVAYIRVKAAGNSYQATVRLQFTVPQPEDVTIGNASRGNTNARDELTVAENNFNSLIQSQEVTNRVIRQLDLKGSDADYKIDVKPVNNADYFDIIATSKNEALVGQLANVHVNTAIAYYGEVRAKPAAADSSLLAEQVAAADKRVRTAETALTDFQSQNHVTNISSDMDVDQKVLQDLISQRNSVLLNGPSSPKLTADTTLLTQLKVDRQAAVAQGNAAVAARYDDAIANYTQVISQDTASANSMAPIDTLISQYRDDLSRLTVLQPRFATLQNDLDQARTDYQKIVSAYYDGQIAEQAAQNVSFIQVIQPGVAPIEPAPSRLGMITVLAAAGGLIIGVLLAALLEYLFPVESSMAPAMPERPTRKVGATQPAQHAQAVQPAQPGQPGQPVRNTPQTTARR